MDIPIELTIKFTLSIDETGLLTSNDPLEQALIQTLERPSLLFALLRGEITVHDWNDWKTIIPERDRHNQVEQAVRDVGIRDLSLEHDEVLAERIDAFLARLVLAQESLVLTVRPTGIRMSQGYQRRGENEDES